jgi:hypothetical protein
LTWWLKTWLLRSFSLKCGWCCLSSWPPLVRTVGRAPRTKDQLLPRLCLRRTV